MLVREKSTPKTRERNLAREGCNAKVVVKVTTSGKYELVRFCESHTHELVSPRKSQFLRSARKVKPCSYKFVTLI